MEWCYVILGGSLLYTNIHNFFLWFDCFHDCHIMLYHEFHFILVNEWVNVIRGNVSDKTRVKCIWHRLACQIILVLWEGFPFFNLNPQTEYIFENISANSLDKSFPFNKNEEFPFFHPLSITTRWLYSTCKTLCDFYAEKKSIYIDRDPKIFYLFF